MRVRADAVVGKARRLGGWYYERYRPWLRDGRDDGTAVPLNEQFRKPFLRQAHIVLKGESENTLLVREVVVVDDAVPSLVVFVSPIYEMSVVFPPSTILVTRLYVS